MNNIKLYILTIPLHLLSFHSLAGMITISSNVFPHRASVMLVIKKAPDGDGLLIRALSGGTVTHYLAEGLYRGSANDIELRFDDNDGGAPQIFNCLFQNNLIEPGSDFDIDVYYNNLNQTISCTVIR